MTERPFSLPRKRRPRQFDLVVGLTDELPGSFKDWPAKHQDAILIALQNKANDTRLPLAMAHAECLHDVDQGWYVHVVAIEVIPAEPEIGNGKTHAPAQRGTIH